MENKYQEIIDFARQLVRIPSQGEIDGEKNIAMAVFDKLASFGFKPELIGDVARPSVICRVGEGGGKLIWLESCLDTVPAGDLAKWEYPPFDGKIVGNKMFGRGAADAKIGIAIFCYLAKGLVADKNFNGSFFLGFDADEQTGNFFGIKEVIKRAPKADICILGYQDNNAISIGSRGDLRIKLITVGISAHTGSRRQNGINAIHSMGKAIVAISAMEFESAKEPFFEFGSALNFAQIDGGIAINIVPDRCEAKIDIRIIPSQNKEKILSQIEEVLNRLKIKDKSFDYKVEIMQSYEPYLTNPQNEFVKILQRTAGKILGRDIPLIANGQRSVGNVISRLGVPVINAFGCGGGNVHAPNEWIDIETAPQVFEIYKETILAFCKR
jgi:acetylornithine deacetylase/succinyl-diaminopimelate desuccinylase-like protein